MSVRRSALPLRVHQLWDGIQLSGGANSMDLEKLYSAVSSVHKLSKDEINHELEKAVKDRLIVTEVETQEETATYKLPDVDDFEKGDHDWYCFECHLGGNVVLCEHCPRVFHLDCLANDQKPQKDLFICPVCDIKSTKPSVEKLNVEQKALNLMLEYICEHIKQWKVPLFEHADGKTWAQAANRAAKDAWRYNLLVYMPMDMTTIVEKAKGAKFKSLEEFQVDCQTLVHGIAVYFGVELLQGSGIGATFMRETLHDMQEIKLCHDCYRRSNEKDHPWWFCLPCATPHEVVWAKQPGFSFWPAKVMKKDGSKYDVRYFGGNHQRGMVDGKNIKQIDVPITDLRIRKTPKWNKAYGELQIFLKIADNPDAVNSLPLRGKSGSLNKSKGKRSGANVSTEEVVTTKKSRDLSPDITTITTPVPRKSGSRASATTSTTAAAQTNGTPSPTKKTSDASKSSATITARRDSGSKSNSTSPRPTAASMSPQVSLGKPSNKEDDSGEALDSEDLSILNELDDIDNLNEEVTTTEKSRNTDSPITKKTPVPRKSGNRACATTSTTAAAQTNGTPVSPVPTEENSAAIKSSATIPARRDSGSKSNSTAPRPTAASMTPPVSRGKPSNNEDDSGAALDSENLSFLNELDDIDYLNGDAYFSDEDKNELQEKVSEDAVSSSCSESKTIRNTYTQVSHPFGVEVLREKCVRYMASVKANALASLKERHAIELSQIKKKQWCYNCEKEANQFCCWNTAYCSRDCQEQHWEKEHRRCCRRKK